MRVNRHSPQFLLHAIMVAILVWGCLLSLGVLLFRGSWLGAGIGMACTLGFLGCWKLLLWRRERRGGERRQEGERLAD